MLELGPLEGAHSYILQQHGLLPSPRLKPIPAHICAVLSSKSSSVWIGFILSVETSSVFCTNQKRPTT